MKIDITPERVQLGTYFNSYRAEPEKVREFEGIQLVARDNSKGLCDNFIFDRICGEPWAKNLEKIDQDDCDQLFGNPKMYLGVHGFSERQTGKIGDIVAYAVYSAAERETQVQHWGLYTREGVLSRFGNLDVFLHRLEVVPDYYGDMVIFFRPSPFKKVTIMRRLNEWMRSLPSE